MMSILHVHEYRDWGARFRATDGDHSYCFQGQSNFQGILTRYKAPVQPVRKYAVPCVCIVCDPT